MSSGHRLEDILDGESPRRPYRGWSLTEFRFWLDRAQRSDSVRRAIAISDSHETLAALFDQGAANDLRSKLVRLADGGV